MNDEGEQKNAMVINGPARLISEWKSGKDISEYFGDPDMETAVIKAACILSYLGEQEKWIALVEGNRGDKKRKALAEKCRKEIEVRKKWGG